MEKQNYPFEYTFLTSKEIPEDSNQLFKVEFKIASKFIKIPFYNKGIGLTKLIPFKDSLPFKLTDDSGNSYRVNKEMYSAAEVGDYAVLEFKSQTDFQLPLRMTLYKTHAQENV